MKMNILKPIAMLTFLFALSSCTLRDGNVTWNVRLGLDTTPSINTLQPDRGEGSTYFVGEKISFWITTNRPGWVTLISIDPDGYSDIISSSKVVHGTTYFSGPRGSEFRIAPPYGLQRVRAVFSDRPSNVRFRGRYSDDAWDHQTRVFIQNSNSRVYDVAETYFFIR